MTVSELIEFLKKYPSDMIVIHYEYGGYCLMEFGDIIVTKMQAARSDGFISTYPTQPELETVEYLMFPGGE